MTTQQYTVTITEQVTTSHTVVMALTPEQAQNLSLTEAVDAVGNDDTTQSTVTSVSHSIASVNAQ